MNQRGRLFWGTTYALACALASPGSVLATGVPISGFYPFAGISLTDEYDPEDFANPTFFYADYETVYTGTPLGIGGPHFELALIDTGAAATLLTSAADAAFDIEGAGLRGTNTFPIAGATGDLDVVTNDAMAIYASGVGTPNRTSTSPLALNTSLMVGQSSVSLATLPEESALPNILGIPYTSQYAMYIKNSQPQLFTLDGKTVRTPQIEFKSLGSGGQGVISRFVAIDFQDATPFLSPPQYVFDINKILDPDRTPLTDDPLYPTLRLNGNTQPAAAYFIDVDVYNDGSPTQALIDKPFLLDTGADVSVVSSDNAARLGFDVVNDEPDFTVSALGSGGVLEGIPGFYVDHLNIVAAGGSITLEHVPFLVLDLPNPAQVGATLEGLIGMNVFSGRDIVVDPKPNTGSNCGLANCAPRLYVSDPVTSSHNWANATASGTWGTTGNWTSPGTPNILWIANVRNISGSPQEAVVAANTEVWELNVSGSGAATMTARISSGVTLSTFSGTNIEAGGRIRLDGGTLNTQYVDIRGGTLTGAGSVLTGSGPIDGQVENHGGVVAPGNGVGTLSITGAFRNAFDGTLSFELGGSAGSQYDQLVVDGAVSLEGTLAVSLVALGGGSPFAPSVGNSFTLITATGDIGAEFDELTLPDGYNWRLNHTTGSTDSLQLIVGNPGDFNHDNTVDSIDYLVWRQTGLGPLNYNAWRSSFGTTYPSGSAAGAASAVPEPTGAVLILTAACGLAFRRKRLTALARSAASIRCAALLPS